MLYINENIPCRPLNKHPNFLDLELIVFELHQSKHKWLFQGIYKMIRWYWVSKPNKFNLRSLFNNIWKDHSDLGL